MYTFECVLQSVCLCMRIVYIVCVCVCVCLHLIVCVCMYCCVHVCVCMCVCVHTFHHCWCVTERPAGPVAADSGTAAVRGHAEED